MSATPTPPTFPPHTHAKLSPRTYLTAHLTSSPSTRPSGRSPTQSRPITSHTGSLTHCHGSAVLRQGDTAVVCGVRGEILNASDILDHTPSTNHERERIERIGASIAAGVDGDDEKRREEQDHLARLGVLVPNVELNPGCSPEYPPGGPPSATAQALSQRLLSALHNCAVVSSQSLHIYSKPPDAASSEKEEDAMSTSSSDDDGGGVLLRTQGNANSSNQDYSQDGSHAAKAYWTLYIDVLVLSLDHGSRSAFDVALAATLSALSNTKLPSAYWDAEEESVLCESDPEAQKPLILRQDLPLATSFGVFVSTENDLKSKGRGPGMMDKKRRYILADPDALEEDLCEELLTITVAGAERVCRVEKSGGGFLDPKRLAACTRLAVERRTEVLAALGVNDGLSVEWVGPGKGKGREIATQPAKDGARKKGGNRKAEHERSRKTKGKHLSDDTNMTS